MILTAAASGQMRQVYHDLMLWAIYARDRRIETASVEALHHHAMDRVRVMHDVLSQAGVERNQPVAMGWFQDAEKLLVAFFDASARSQFGEAWPSLQRQLYGHERLGQEVFERIEALAGTSIQAEAPVEALEVFERCLALGYHGAAVSRQMSPEAIERFARKLAITLQHSPPGLSPGLPALALQQRWTPLWGPLSILGVAVVVLVLLAGGTRLTLHLRAAEALRQADVALSNHPACTAGVPR
jgi:type IV/VI secretion system ImpK/VasF family protein